MAYGIRAWSMISAGKLGLHSALLQDHEDESGVLLVSRNRVGKSSIGRAIEAECPRFTLLADDWSEVDLSSGAVAPVSCAFSVANPGVDYRSVFESFGKPFYVKGEAVPENVVLRRIIELHDTQQLTRDMFLLQSLGHIPFLRQPVGASIFTEPCGDSAKVIAEIRARKARIVKSYEELTGACEATVVVNDRERNSLREAIERVREVIE